MRALAWAVVGTAFLATPLSAAMIDLGTLRGRYCEARALNNRSQVVGGSDTAFWETHAFLWQNGVMTGASVHN